ncbi:hydroxyethylthiazole kinase [Muricauda sp. TY007]|uniref:hydroxyethylthiazole kinase n=1 Tax=Allomuricauda sp. TY007 TaxID=2683200 RepID=UPI0013C0D3C3|nr:hydroxyethylthiazole kinase [Muricauda sp. TY007]NDV16509.1 hydroxyethylthiazole kinase [Muricauda sp. TY007]
MAMEKNLWRHIQSVKSKSPLVHNITNYVVMNNTANALLAAGASPIMAHAKSEVRDMVALANATVINIGTLDEYWGETILLAAETAHALGKPWVLDPVGAGATPFRDKTLQQLLAFKPTVVKGNASEIMALAQTSQEPTKGVDSTATSDEAVAAAHTICSTYGTMVCISGAKDIITDGTQAVQIENGHPLMAKVTGTGCTASALIGAFIGVTENKTEAVTAAMVLMGIAGELAEKRSNGPGTLQLHLIDTLYTLSEKEFFDHIKICNL